MLERLKGDLAVACSIFSPLIQIAFGEISLSGDVRAVQFTESRMQEAIKLGYKTIYCPPLNDETKHLLKMGSIIEVSINII